MAEEKKPAEQESAKTTAKPAARKKTTAAKAPAKTVQRVRKSAKKAEQAETKVELKDTGISAWWPHSWMRCTAPAGTRAYP